MKAKINRLQLVRLWNSEYSIFVNQIVAIILKYQPEVLHLQKAYAKLTAMMPNLSKIKAQELSNSLTNSLQELDTERGDLISAIATVVKALGKLSKLSIAPDVSVMKRFLNIHGSDISKANYISATERTRELLADYNAKADVKAAALALNLKMLFDQLSVVNTQFATLFLQRTADEAAQEKVDARAIRTETDAVLTAFFDAFEFCSSEYDELDYTTPANELNDLIAYYKTHLKARTTRKKGSKVVSTETPIVPAASQVKL
ncbi:MAG: DUF6261 family protein [Alphaproteobacteria bacterium]